MIGRNLSVIYTMMHAACLVRSKRDFSRRWLGRGKTFLKDFEQRPERHFRRVSPRSIARLRARLLRIAAISPRSLRPDIEKIIREIDSSCAFADFYLRGR